MEEKHEVEEDIHLFRSIQVSAMHYYLSHHLPSEQIIGKFIYTIYFQDITRVL